jgi:hypothetical protein
MRYFPAFHSSLLSRSFDTLFSNHFLDFTNDASFLFFFFKQEDTTRLSSFIVSHTSSKCNWTVTWYTSQVQTFTTEVGLLLAQLSCSENQNSLVLFFSVRANSDELLESSSTYSYLVTSYYAVVDVSMVHRNFKMPVFLYENNAKDRCDWLHHFV